MLLNALVVRVGLSPLLIEASKTPMSGGKIESSATVATANCLGTCIAMVPGISGQRATQMGAAVILRKEIERSILLVVAVVPTKSSLALTVYRIE